MLAAITAGIRRTATRAIRPARTWLLIPLHKSASPHTLPLEPVLLANISPRGTLRRIVRLGMDALTWSAKVGFLSFCPALAFLGLFAVFQPAQRHALLAPDHRHVMLASQVGSIVALRLNHICALDTGYYGSTCAGPCPCVVA